MISSLQLLTLRNWTEVKLSQPKVLNDELEFVIDAHAAAVTIEELLDLIRALPGLNVEPEYAPMRRYLMAMELLDWQIGHNPHRIK